MKKSILFVFGTRPEVIKLAPVILELKKYQELYNVIICNTESGKSTLVNPLHLEKAFLAITFMPSGTL